MLPVTEHFVSINGEGPHAGEAALFIRFRGCDLCCSYCDTRWSCTNDAPAEMMSVNDLSALAHNTGITNITLTGGEPLLQRELPELCAALMRGGHRVEIETNGSMPIKELAGAKLRPVFTMDYKLPSSGCEDSMLTENFDHLGIHDTVKFVAGDREDLSCSLEIINKFSLCGKCHIYISPVFGRIDPREIVEFLIENKLNGVRLQLQLHKFIWPPETRGV